MIAWATEVASFFLSRGLAFALLALIQVLPEFAVEAVITQQAAEGTIRAIETGGTIAMAEGLDLVTANFTGANRLLVGLFLPMVYFVAAWGARPAGISNRSIVLPPATSLEVFALLVPTLYSFSFALRGSITLIDAGVLTLMYVVYLVLAYKMPTEDHDASELPFVPRWIYNQPARLRTTFIVALFGGGGALLFLSVHPFYENTIHLAAALGLPAYFLFQWIAPLLSESPELITVSYWAKTGRAPLGVTNVVSSKINQWTLLIAMIPVVYASVLWKAGFGLSALPLGNAQQVEVLLTAAQGLFAVACLMTLTLERWQAWTLLVLWAVQAADPLFEPFLVGWLPSPFPAGLASGSLVREWFTLLYLALTVFVLVKDRRRLRAIPSIQRVWREHVRGSSSREEQGA